MRDLDDAVELPDERYFDGVRYLKVNFQDQQTIRRRTMEDRATLAVERWLSGGRARVLALFTILVGVCAVGSFLLSVSNFVAQHAR